MVFPCYTRSVPRRRKMESFLRTCGRLRVEEKGGRKGI